MDPRMTGVRLAVADVERSCQFYEALGWSKGGISFANIAAFQLGSMVFSLWRKDILKNELGLDAPPAPATGAVVLDHHVASKEAVAKILDEVESAGGKIICQAQDGPVRANHYGCFEDPDGHVWRVVYSNILKFNEDGTVSLPD